MKNTRMWRTMETIYPIYSAFHPSPSKWFGK